MQPGQPHIGFTSAPWAQAGCDAHCTLHTAQWGITIEGAECETREHKKSRARTLKQGYFSTVGQSMKVHEGHAVEGKDWNGGIRIYSREVGPASQSIIICSIKGHGSWVDKVWNGRNWNIQQRLGRGEGLEGWEGNGWAKYAQQCPAQLDLTPTLMFLLASSRTQNENTSKHLTGLNYLHLKCLEYFELYASHQM